MGAMHNDGDDHRTPPDRSTVILMLVTIGDTTWRMFVPIIGLMVAGLLGDRSLHTTPWLMIVGLVVGVALAALLVKRQYQRVNS